MNKKRVFFQIGIPVLCIIFMLYYLYGPINVKITLVSSSKMTEALDLSGWDTIIERTDRIEEEYLKSFGVSIPDIDFTKNNLIVSFGREIKSLSYTTMSRFKTPFKQKPYIGEVVFGKETNTGNIYFYKIRKVNVISKYAMVIWGRYDFDNLV